MQRRRVILGAGEKRSRLPREYQEVEYLESTGTQYIKSGFSPYFPLTIKTKIYVKAYNGHFFSAAQFSNNARCGLGVTDTGLFSFLAGDHTGYVNTGNVSLNIWYEITAYYDTVSSLYADGIFISSINSGLRNTPELYFFARNANGTTNQYSSIRMSAIEIEKDGLVRHYIPCYRKSDNKPGMYDTVTKTFFTNAGTGEFIVQA